MSPKIRGISTRKSPRINLAQVKTKIDKSNIEIKNLREQIYIKQQEDMKNKIISAYGASNDRLIRSLDQAGKLSARQSFSQRKNSKQNSRRDETALSMEHLLKEYNSKLKLLEQADNQFHRLKPLIHTASVNTRLPRNLRRKHGVPTEEARRSGGMMSGCEPPLSFDSLERQIQI